MNRINTFILLCISFLLFTACEEGGGKIQFQELDDRSVASDWDKQDKETKNDFYWKITLLKNGDGSNDLLRIISKRPKNWKSRPLSEHIIISWTFAGALPNKEEIERLDKLEKSLVNLVDSDFSVLSSVKTSNGIREWSFYTMNADYFLSSLNSYLNTQPNFPIKLKHKKDPDWIYYENLFSQLPDNLKTQTNRPPAEGVVDWDATSE